MVRSSFGRQPELDDENECQASVGSLAKLRGNGHFGYGSDYKLTLPFVEEATRRFVKARAMREIMSLALVSRMNVIMFGRGGHGKSEFTEAVLSAVDGL